MTKEKQRKSTRSLTGIKVGNISGWLTSKMYRDKEMVVMVVAYFKGGRKVTECRTTGITKQNFVRGNKVRAKEMLQEFVQAKADELSAKMLLAPKADFDVANATVLGFIDYFMQRRKDNIGKMGRGGITTKTYRNNEYEVGKLKLYLTDCRQVKDLPLHSFTREDLQHFIDMQKSYVNRLGVENSPITINHTITFFKTAFKFAYSENIMRDDIGRGILHEDTSDTDEQPCLNRDEAVQFYHACEDLEVGAVLQATLLMGTRISETLALHFDDINFEQKTIHLRRTVDGDLNVSTKMKTKSSKALIPLIEPLEIIFKKMLERNQARNHDKRFDGFIFRDKKGKLYRKNIFAEITRSVCRELGITEITTHGLRHTMTTLSVRGGVDVKSLQALIRHKNITTTLGTYTHTDMTDKIKAMQTFQDYLDL